MEFGIEKSATLSMKRGKLQHSTGVQLANGKTIPGLGEGQDYKYLRISQADSIKHDELKAKVKKEYAGRVMKTLKSKLNGGNTVTAINTWAVALLRYTPGIVNWTQDELLTWIGTRGNY